MSLSDCFFNKVQPPCLSILCRRDPASSWPSLSISALEWWGVSLLSKDVVLLWPFQKLRACNICYSRSLFRKVFHHWQLCFFTLSRALDAQPTPRGAVSSRVSRRSPLLCKQQLWWECSVTLSALQWAESLAGWSPLGQWLQSKNEEEEEQHRNVSLFPPEN